MKKTHRQSGASDCAYRTSRTILSILNILTRLEGNILAKDMTSGQPLPLIWRFALPMIVGALFQQLYNTVDMLIVGNIVGSRALAAVGATGSATFFALTLMIGVTTGFSAVISQYFGAKDMNLVRKSFVSAIYICGASAVILFAIGMFGAEPLMLLLNTPDDILPDAVMYLRICVAGSIGTVVYNSAASVLRAIGDSRTPLLFLIAASVLSILLNMLFIMVFGMGVMGAALSTVIAQALSAAACVIYLFKRYEILRLRLHDFQPHPPTLGFILKIGLPVALQSALLSVGDMTITGVVNRFGTDVVAAYATGTRIMFFSTVFCMTLAQAFAVFVGQNLGARQIERIKNGFRDTFAIVAAICVVMTVLVFVFDDALARMFISGADAHIEGIVSITRPNLRITAVFYIFLGLIWLYNYTLRSMGDVAVPFVSGILELVLKVGLSVLFSWQFGYVGVWFAMPLGWVLGIIPSAIRFHSGGWHKLSERFGG